MRAIFIVLLIANLAFFSHQYFLGAGDETVSPANQGSDTKNDSKNSLRLLSEVNRQGDLTKRAEDIDKAKSSENESKTSELCTMLGPYEQLLQAEYAVERLNALGVSARISPIEIQEGESFWVYLKPEMSEKEAVRRLYELQKKNIESHVITKGELTNGISFGRFAEYAEAEVKLNEVKSQGYEAAIKRLPKTIQETWVVVDAGFAEKVGDSVWGDLLSKQSGLEKRQNFCLGVASQ
ncbi:SPOR domain-containing protein [Cellvibrio mixtus]|uniref:SPOR domain-containing protein n=1 Tax=Cellvibrio mixtus TaxID=39650 RepID=UPI000587C54B|nr:hypothetical protein [Cellvibrio mixtus]